MTRHWTGTDRTTRDNPARTAALALVAIALVVVAPALPAVVTLVLTVTFGGTLAVGAFVEQAAAGALW